MMQIEDLRLEPALLRENSLSAAARSLEAAGSAR
jgi:hypothetical protein